jgi:hypothetical protein
MKILLVGAVALAASAGAVRAAHAGCRGGGGSSGSHGGGGGHDSSSSGSSCTEVSDVVGYQHCGHFGEGWSGRAGLPALTAELGFFTRQLDSGFGASGVMEHDTGSFAYDVASVSDRATAAGGTVRVAMALPVHLYVGAELEIGALVAGTAADVSMSAADGAAPAGPTMSARETLYMGGGAVAGVRGHLGRLALSAEVVGGARDVSLSVKSRHGSCVLSDTHHRTSAFAEPRLRLDFWLSPWLSVAGFAGSEIDGDNRMVGASLAFHVRAFDRGL